jgi:hypothetical protein
MKKTLHFLVWVCVGEGISVKASSFSSWPLLATAGKLKRSGERQRISSNKVLGVPTNQYLQRKELRMLYERCLGWFDSTPEKLTKPYLQEYLGHLVVLLLISIPAPRVQVFQSLVLNQTLIWNGEQYTLRFDGENPPLKSKKPLLHVLPPHLTKPLNDWITHCRPLLVASSQNQIVFPNSKGAGKRYDWAKLTSQITLRYVEKSVPPSRFR